MGNDPGNGVDPTGGFFDPGPLAQLACPGSGGGSFLKVLNTISAIGSVASKGMGLGGSIGQQQNNIRQSENVYQQGGGKKGNRTVSNYEISGNNESADLELIVDIAILNESDLPLEDIYKIVNAFNALDQYKGYVINTGNEIYRPDGSNRVPIDNQGRAKSPVP
jgi:hypothetical protein